LSRELSRLTAIGSNISDTSYIGDSTANWKFIEDVVESCILWKPMDGYPELTTSSGKYVHQLAGEIHLDKGLIPSFNAVIFSVEVCMLNIEKPSELLLISFGSIWFKLSVTVRLSLPTFRQSNWGRSLRENHRSLLLKPR